MSYSLPQTQTQTQQLLSDYVPMCMEHIKKLKKNSKQQHTQKSPNLAEHCQRLKDKKRTISRRDQRDRFGVLENDPILDQYNDFFGQDSIYPREFQSRLKEIKKYNCKKTLVRFVQSFMPSSELNSEQGVLEAHNLIDQIWNATSEMFSGIQTTISGVTSGWSTIITSITNMSSMSLSTARVMGSGLSLLYNPDFWTMLIVVLIWLISYMMDMEPIGRAILLMYVLFKHADLRTALVALLAASVTYTGAASLKTIRVDVQQTTKHIGVLEADVSDAKSICVALCAFAALFYGVSASEIPGMSGFAKKMNEISQISRGTECLTSMYTRFIDGIFSAMGYEVDGCVEGSLPKDVTFITDTVKAFTLERRQALAANAADCALLERLNDTFNSCRVKYSNNRALTTILDKFQGPVVNLYALACQVNPSSAKHRIEPVVLMFRGDSGVGKSTLLYHVATHVLVETEIIKQTDSDEIIQERISKCIFPRSSENEFWEGYSNQTCTLVDDAFQIRDSQSSPNPDYMELIRMSNPFPYPLHMATLSQKANTNFTSKVVIYTTNVERLAPESCVSQEAVQRRVTMPYKVEIKPQFADHQGRLRPEFKTGVIRTDVYQFRWWNTGTGEISRQTFGFDEVMQEMVKTMRSNKIKFENSQVDLTRYARNLFQRFEGPLVNPNPVDVIFQELRDPPQNQVLIGDILEPQPDLMEFVEPEDDLYGAELQWDLFDFKGWLTPSVVSPAQCKQEFENLLLSMPVEERTSDWDSRKEFQRNDRCASHHVGYYDDREYTFRMQEFVRRHPYHPASRTLPVYVSPKDRGIYEVTNIVWDNIKEALSRIEYRNIAYLAMAGIIGALGIYVKYKQYQTRKRLLQVPDLYPKHKETAEAIRKDLDGVSTSADKEIINDYKRWLGLHVDTKAGEKLEADLESGKSKTAVRKKTALEEASETSALRFESGKGKQAKAKKTNLESWMSENARDVSTKVLNNMRTLNLWNDTELLQNCKANVLFVEGRHMLMNKHYCHLFDIIQEKYPKLIVEFVNCGVSTFKVHWSELTKRASYYRNGLLTDLNVIEVPNINRFPSLRTHIAKRDDFNAMVGKRATLVKQESNTKILKFGAIIEIGEKAFTNEFGSTQVAHSLLCDISSEKGDCGSTYVLDDAHSTRKIVGFHFAGTQGKATAIPLTQEDLYPLLEEVKELQYEYEAGDVPGVFQGNVMYIGKIKHEGKVCAPFYPRNTKLVKTKMFGVAHESTCAPAVLDYRMEEGSSLAKGLSKQFGAVAAVDSYYLQQASFDYRSLLSKMKGSQRVLTFKEAVQGIAETKYIRGVNRVKSAGFPYSLTTKQKGKTEWFGSDDWDFSSKKCQELERLVDYQIFIMQNRGYVDYIFSDTLKDETRSLEKVAEGKTRVFAAAPLDFIVVFRMYFMTFLSTMMENQIENESAVGIQAQSTSWHQLAQHLQKYGNSMVAGDFSNYDGSLNPHILWEIYHIIESFYQVSEGYKDEDRKVRFALWTSIVSSKHMIHGHLYQLNHSQPSGNPSTAILNSMYNSLATRYVYYSTGNSNFNDHVTMIAYGDDNIISISPKILDSFNQDVLTEGFANIGMTYTDEDKSGQARMKTIDSVSFLQRGFRFEESIQMYVAPLKLDSIVECFNWIHETHDEIGVIEQNFEMSQLELAMHDEKTYGLETLRLRRAIQKVYGRNFPAISRMSTLYQIRDGKASEVFARFNWL
jgi:hypothetical protein